MACLVTSHFMHGVVDCVESFFFGTFGEFKFAARCAVFCFDALFKIDFRGWAYEFTEHFAEFCGVFGFFKCRFFPVKTDFGIAFAVCRSCHCKVHTDFSAFAFEVGFQTFVDVLWNALSDANDVFCRPNLFCAVILDEFATGTTALRAFFWCAVAFVYVSAYRTYKFCHSSFSLKSCCFLLFSQLFYLYYPSSY